MAQDLSIIGCYAQARPARARKATRKATRTWPATEARGARWQTELGHGSNVRGIETTATFVRETDEFEINTPSLSAVPFPTTSLPATRCGLNLCDAAQPARQRHPRRRRRAVPLARGGGAHCAAAPSRRLR